MHFSRSEACPRVTSLATDPGVPGIAASSKEVIGPEVDPV
jgi:hypothetical protein